MVSQKMKIKNDLTEGKIVSQIITFALPLIATSVLQLLFNTADTVVVGRWGGENEQEREIALAAVGSCGALISLLVNLFMGLSIGAGVCVAHDVGAKKYDEVSKTIHTSITLSIIFGIPITVIGIIFAPDFLMLMGIDEALLEQATLYMRAFFCGMPANLVYNYCAAMLRSTGDTTRPLFFLSSAGVVNVIFNVIMVVGFGLGAMGVGIATAVSHWISCILIITFMLKTDGVCKFVPKNLKIHKEKLYKVLSIGLPAGIQNSLFAISNVIIQSAIQSFGNTALVAGNTAASNLDGYIWVTMNSVATSAMTFTGQHVGAGKHKRLKTVVVYHCFIVIVAAIIMSLTLFAFGRQLIGIFSPGNSTVADYGMIRLGIIGLTYFLCGLMDTGSYILRGFGKSFVPTVTCLIGSCLLRIVWVYTIFAAHHELWVLLLSYPITWFVTAAVLYVFVILEFKKFSKQRESNK